MGQCAQPIGLRGDVDKRQVEEQIQGVLVYALYGLTPEEIKLVDGAAK
jgi:hypothetical protein